MAEWEPTACRLSSSRQKRGAACSGWDREHGAFLGHEIRGPAGTRRGGVSMAGGRQGQDALRGRGVG